MRAFFAQGGVDQAIAALASKQYGVLTRAQLLDVGLERSAIRRRLAAGRLHRLHAGVYAVGHRAPRREARWLAAVLAGGEGAVLSHRSAAALWRIREGEGSRPDVTVATRSGRRQPGVVLHRSQLADPDRSEYHGIPVTSPARTLVDLAHEVDQDELVRALRETQFMRRFDLSEMREVLARRPCRILRILIDDLVLTQSGIEDQLLGICDRHGIGRPLTQQMVCGRRVDFLWPRERVVVETDGWEAHASRSAFQADRTMSNRLQLDGYYVLRFTSADVKRRPGQVARQIHKALAATERGA
jgi:very-short-patch-repair endonuclease